MSNLPDTSSTHRIQLFLGWLLVWLAAYPATVLLLVFWAVSTSVIDLHHYTRVYWIVKPILAAHKGPALAAEAGALGLVVYQRFAAPAFYPKTVWLVGKSLTLGVLGAIVLMFLASAVLPHPPSLDSLDPE